MMPSFPKHPWELTIEPTWWVLSREPGMDDMYEKAGDSLDKMVEDLGIHLFRAGKDDSDTRVFLARYEIPAHQEGFKFTQAVFAENAVAFIDFLAGFPIDCVEMLVGVGEISTKKENVVVLEGKGMTAPVPKPFFKWPEKDKVLLNLTAIATKDVAKILAKNLDGKPKPKKAHWWFRVNLTAKEGQKWPVPGEFFGLGVRMMPTVPWGHQKSNPFIYSGQWIDTAFYTSAKIIEVIEPTDTIPCCTYRVEWRKEKFVVYPTDFAEYRVGDRVTIVKDISIGKKTQTWEDEDMTKPEEIWQIAPVTFYGLGYQEG